MKIKVTNEQQILQEALKVLLANLEPSKVMGFWAACQHRSKVPQNWGI